MRIHLAALRGDLVEVAGLIHQDSTLARALDPQDRTPLSYAADGGSVEVASLLMDSGACVDHRDVRGTTALFRACLMGHEELVAVLVGKGADLWQRTKRDRYTGLMAASLSGHIGVVRQLLTVARRKSARGRCRCGGVGHGVDGACHVKNGEGRDGGGDDGDGDYMDARAATGETALWMACRTRQVEVCRALLEAGANPMLDVWDRSKVTGDCYKLLQVCACSMPFPHDTPVIREKVQSQLTISTGRAPQLHALMVARPSLGVMQEWLRMYTLCRARRLVDTSFLISCFAHNDAVGRQMEVSPAFLKQRISQQGGLAIGQDDNAPQAEPCRLPFVATACACGGGGEWGEKGRKRRRGCHRGSGCMPVGLEGPGGGDTCAAGVLLDTLGKLPHGVFIELLETIGSGPTFQS